MKEQVTIERKTDEMWAELRLSTNKGYTISVKKRKSTILEFEDVLFHFDSAVLLPTKPEGPSSSDSGGSQANQEEITGLKVIKAIYIFIQQNPGKKLIVAGHTDTSGPDRYNFNLSELRAKSALSVLMGDRDGENGWVKTVRAKNKVEDYQQILKHYHDKYGWDCDPGEVDNVYGEKTRKAIENFQRTYKAEFGKSIQVTGTMNDETWGAVFDVYMLELAQLMGEKDESGLGKWRQAVQFVDVDRKIVPCGESVPRDTPGLDGLKSQTNRRVEMVFFDADEHPFTRINCPPSGDSPHPIERCPIYNPDWVDHEYIDPASGEIKVKDIKMIKVDDHFAPSKEELDVVYEIKGFTIDAVNIEVSSDDYPNNPIYQRPLTAAEKTDGIHIIKWDGKANCADGPLKDRFINPLYSPYRVKLVAVSGQQGEAEFKVLYHSVKVEQGSYTADGNAPDKAGELVKWVQFKLNELGYFAGPVDGVKGAQTRRAMKRYTYAMPGNYGTDKEIDDETNATLQDQLENNKGRREIFQNGKLPQKGEDARAYIDHDYFYEVYSGADFSNPQGHCIRDADKLDRFEIPLECCVYLVGKADTDGTKAGIDAPRAIGEVDIEWLVKDPVEDTSFLPVPTADIPSRGKQYVEAALVATGQVAGNPTDSQDNCPEANNRGQRKTGADTNPNYFRIGNELPPFRSESVGAKVYCKVHQDTAASPHKIGRSGVLFRGSYIAGDNYVIEARISFERLGNKAALTQSHESFTGKQLKEILFDETGKMTLWRHQHLSAVVNWPDPDRTINWGEIAIAYWIGHCDLNTAHADCEIEDLFTTDADKDAYLDLVKLRYPAYDRTEMEFDAGGLYPLEVPSQGLTEDPDDYKRRIRNLIRTFANGSDDFQDDLAKMIYSKVSQKRPAGSIAFRPNWVRTVKVRKKLPIIGIINPFSSEDYVPGFVCLGLPKGVALLDNGMTHEEQDGFLFAHEMGHCRYLLHHETDRDVHDPTSPKFGVTQYDNPNDHDRSDHNCTMCYPDGIATRPGLTWNKGDTAEARFCGKCILKLRGWNVRDPALPASS